MTNFIQNCATSERYDILTDDEEILEQMNQM